MTTPADQDLAHVDRRRSLAEGATVSAPRADAEPTVTTTDTPLEAGGRARPDGGTVAMLVGTVVNGLGAYVFTMIAGRVLGPERYAPLAVLWTCQFLLMTVLFLPTEQLVIRQVILGGGVRPLRRVVRGIVIGAALATALFALVTLDSLFAGDVWFVALAGLLAGGYGIYATGRGRLAGRRRYLAYATVTAAEAILRLVVAGVVLLLAAREVGLAFAMAAAPLVGLPLLFTHFPEPAGEHLHVEPRRFLSGYVTGNAAAQALLAAGPLAVAAVGGSASAVSIVTVTLTLFRFPLTLSYNLLARLLPPLIRLVETGQAHRARRTVLAVSGGGAALAALGGVVGGIVGAPVVGMLYGTDFTPDTRFAGLVSAGAVVALTGLIVQQVLVAMDQTRRLAASWWAGLALAAAVVVLLPSSPSVRVGAAFVAGNGLALVLLVTAVLTHIQPDRTR